ncbi:kinase-like protein [Sarocladium strictum]
MSLIPFHPQEGREIVLRHRNALVVRDPTSQRLEIRGLSNCPTCHRPWQRSSSPDRHFDRSSHISRDPYVDPNYFRMLRPAGDDFIPDRPPSSPVRRLAEPALPVNDNLQSSYVEIEDEERRSWRSNSSEPLPQTSKIRRESFSPNYFKDFFIEEGVLGKGGKGVVLLVQHQLDGCPLGFFACKRVPVGDDHAWLERVLVEVRLLAQLGHPNLVSYRHVWLEDAQLTRFGPPVVCAFILQQYCNSGDLHKYVLGEVGQQDSTEELKARMRRRSKGQAELPKMANGKPPLPPEEIYSLFKDITSGVAHLHAAGYVHRDLKPSNCLLHRDGGFMTCLISDFGEVQPSDAIRKSTGSTGTISYCAPEVLQMDATGTYGNFTFKSDIFSMGMILYFMCFGKLPYHSANALQEELEDIDELRDEISHWTGFEDEKRLRPDLPSKLYKLLKQLLAINPTQRPSAEDVLNALTSEARFDGFSKGGRAPTSGFGLQRVQNLDSPAVPGTPVPEQRGPGAAPESSLSWPQATVPNIGDGPNDMQGLRRRSTAMTLSRSREGFSPVLRPSAPSEQSTDDHEEALLSPLLLPSPPNTTVLGRLNDATSHALQRTSELTGITSTTVEYTSRLSLFLVKLSSLAQPCWPYLPTLRVAIPLVILAALDLRMSPPNINGGGSSGLTRRAIAISTFSLFLHASLLWFARSQHALCISIRHEGWPDW